jgi:His-Xaa-Ser system radical SAM maturase HxsB
MKCVYCHASSKCAGDDGYDMSLETARKTVDFIFQTPSKGVTIEFQGGEPLMNFEVLKYIVDYAKEVNNSFKKDLRFSIVTNLTLMDDEKLDFLLKTGVSICTSLDGPVTINKKNRIFLGDEKIEYWIRKINEKSKINALPTITKNNIGYWKEVIDEYVRLGLNNIHLRFLNNLGYAKDMWSKISYSAEDFVDMWVKSMDYIFELNKKGIDMKERMALIISSKLLMNKEPNYSELRSPCGAIIGQIAYNYDGFIYTCDEARMLGEEIFRVGSVNQDMKSVVHSDKSCNIIASACNDFFCYSCVFSPYCGICPVCNYVEQGSVVGKIPQTDRCKVYKAQFTYLFNKILFDKDALEILNKWLTTN